jgi:SAM-dependent methyltransferase
VASPDDVRRKVALVVGIVEYLLERPIRTVLDVGCGEAPWRSPLRRLRPRARYDGVDPSEYVVRRFGRARNIRRGSLERLDEVALRGPYDLVVCCDVLHFMTPRDFDRGLEHISALMGGVAYLPLFTAADRVVGDVRSLRQRSPEWYRRRLRAAGLVPVGLGCYVGSGLADTLAALERPVAAGG